VAAAEQNAARCRFDSAVRRFQQRRFSGAVRSDQSRYFAAFRRKRNARQYRAAAELYRNIFYFKHSRHLARLSKYMKSGAPISAVIAPTGNSRGAIIVRAAVSAATTNAAPTIAENGTTSRLSLPNASRTRCGTINPT